MEKGKPKKLVKKYFIEDLREFLAQDDRIIYRNLRGKQAEIENVYWELLSQSLVGKLQSNTLDIPHFSACLEYSFVRTFTDVSTSFKKHTDFTANIGRSVYENLEAGLTRSKEISASGGLTHLLIDTKSAKDDSIQKVIDLVVTQYKSGEKMTLKQPRKIVPLSDYDRLNSRINQPISEIFTESTIFSDLIITDEDKVTALSSIELARKLIRRLHDHMKQVVQAYYTIVSLISIQRPFLINDHLPFLRSKDIDMVAHDYTLACKKSK
jgi:hypothetical protein